MSGYGGSPDSAYPDGYLGTITNRRGDKLGNLSRQNARSYDRGVHKGERINAGDYLWPSELNLMTGIKLEKQGKKFSPPGAMPVQLTNDGKSGPRGIPRGIQRADQEIIDLQRRSLLKELTPGWK